MKAFGDVLFDDDENKLPGWSFSIPADKYY